MKQLFLITIASLLLANLTFGQEIEYPNSFNEPMQLFPEAMGDFHWEISSNNHLAQEYFNQGFQLMYAFAKDDAVRSFQASHFADPDCAVCWWGEALSLIHI